MTKESTIGNNPLTAYLNKETKQAIKPTVKDVEEACRKERLTIHISEELVNRVKNAVYWEPGLTLAEFSETALAFYINKVEKKKGEPYPQRPIKKLKSGRPMK